MSYDALLASLSPVGWWKLADGIGATTMVDSSGNGYGMTVAGTPTFGQTGPILGTPADTAALLNGSTGRGSSASTALNLNVPFSVCAWVKTIGAVSMAVVSDTAHFFFHVQTGGTVRLADLNGHGIVTTATVNDGNWHFIEAELTTGFSDAKIHIDGVSVSFTTTGSWAPVGGAGTTYLGSQAAGAFFNGTLAQVAIFNSVLGTANVAALYAAAFPPTVSSVAPTQGQGGTRVVITGTNFTGITAVKFGVTDAPSFTVDSSTQITATAPSGHGPSSVAVTTNGGTST